MAIREEVLNFVSLPKKEFDNQRTKPDNYLFFVYEEYIDENKQANMRIRLYKGRKLILGDIIESVSKYGSGSFKIGKVELIAAGSVPDIYNTGDEKNVVLNFKIPADKILDVGEIKTGESVKPSVTITDHPKDKNKALLNITFPKWNVVQAGVAELLTADATPTVAVNGNPDDPKDTEEAKDTVYVHIGVPSSPYTKITEDTPGITLNNTGLGYLGFIQKTDYLDDGWLNDIKIVGKTQIIKNNTNYPCFCFAKTFPANNNPEEYSSSDCILLIPPQGKGMIKHSKTYPGNRVGKSEVYPAMVTKPKIVYEVLFNGTDNVVYDNINGIRTEISGSNLNFNESIGLSGDNLVITLPATEPPTSHREETAWKDDNVNKLDSILYPYAFHCMIHFIGSSAAKVDSSMQCCAGAIVDYKNLSEKILVMSPFHKYSTDNLDLIKWKELSLFNTGLTHWIYHAISNFTFTVKSGAIKGIRIIAGTPADFLRDPEFLLYKFD